MSLRSNSTCCSNMLHHVCENANGNLQFHLDCHNLCVHIWKTQLKIQFAIPFENCPEYSSISFLVCILNYIDILVCILNYVESHHNII